jgi:hypothetical protein
MALPHRFGRLACRVAQHEMGHYVAARALRFRTGMYRSKKRRWMLRRQSSSFETSPGRYRCFRPDHELDKKLFSRAIELVEEHAGTIIGLATKLADRVQALNSAVTLEAAYLKGLPAVAQIAPARP